VVKPRQPLCDLNPFDSIFLIFRRVDVAGEASKRGRNKENAVRCGPPTGNGEKSAWRM